MADEKVRNQLEIALHVLKGMVLLSSLGYTNPDVPVMFQRALELGDKVDNSPDLFTMIVGLWMYYLIKAEYGKAKELSDRMLSMAQESKDPPQLLQAYYCLGYTEYLIGNMGQAVAYLEQAVSWDCAGYDYTRQSPSQDDSRVHAYSMLAASLWLWGDAARSQLIQEKTFELVDEVGQPYAEVWALYQRSLLHHMRRDFDKIHTSAGLALEIARTRGFTFFVPLTQFYLAFCIDNPAERLRKLRESHRQLVDAGAGSTQSYMLSSLAEQCIDQESLEEASILLDRSRDFIDQHGESLFEPEYLRVRARLLQMSSESGAAQARELLQRGVESALEHGTPPLALRCALALCELGLPDDVNAENILRDVLGKFHSESEDKEFLMAKTILEKLHV